MNGQILFKQMLQEVAEGFHKLRVNKNAKVNKQFYTFIMRVKHGINNI
jgi:hypothetical protein